MRGHKLTRAPYTQIIILSITDVASSFEPLGLDIQKSIDHFEKYHNTLFVPTKFCINIVSIFSWDLLWSQGKIKAIIFKILEGQAKSIMVFLKVAYWQNSRQHISSTSGQEDQ